MASTVVTPIAMAIGDLILGLAVTPAVSSFVYDPELSGLNSLPIGVVNAPEIKRPVVTKADSQLSSADWTMKFPVVLAVALDDPPANIAQLVETLEAFVKGIDDNPSLGLSFVEQSTVIITTGPTEVSTGTYPYVYYACQVQVLALV